MTEERPDGWDNLGDEAAYREVMRRLRDYDTMADNLKATQARSGELLEETRAQRRRIKELEDELAVLRKVTDFDRLRELLEKWQ